MKKIVVIVVLATSLWGYLNRDRFYWRSPMSTVARKGVPDTGAEVFVNLRRDVLAVNNGEHGYQLSVQPGRVGIVKELSCMRGIVCMTDGVAPTLVEPMANARVVRSGANQLAVSTAKPGEKTLLKNAEFTVNLEGTGTGLVGGTQVDPITHQPVDTMSIRNGAADAAAVSDQLASIMGQATANASATAPKRAVTAKKTAQAPSGPTVQTSSTEYNSGHKVIEFSR